MALAAVVMAFAGVSVFGEERPDWRTAQADLRVDVRAPHLIEGVVADVTRDGDDIFLRTGDQTIRIEAHGGVKAWYRGRAYRVRDLERGDVVRVDLDEQRGNRYRARSIEVLRSISHDQGYGRGDRDYRYDRNRGDGRRDRGYDRRDRQRMRLDGRVVALDRHRDQLVIRVDSRRELQVDLRDAYTGSKHSPLRKIRVGDVIRLEGWFDRGVFVAQSLEELRGRERRNY